MSKKTLPFIKSLVILFRKIPDNPPEYITNEFMNLHKDIVEIKHNLIFNKVDGEFTVRQGEGNWDEHLYKFL